jgi:cardiolipin synthase A/B
MERLEAVVSTIYLEMYIIHEDAVGLRFADMLMNKARGGVRVRLLYDWLGGAFRASRGYWQKLRNAGVARPELP